MKTELDKIPDDLSVPENAKKAHAILKRHISFLQSRLEVEPDDMERQILQARIDNMIQAQELVLAEQRELGHG